MKRFDWTLKFNVTEYSCSWDCNVFTRAGQSPTTCDLCAGIPGMHFELDDVHFGFQKGEQGPSNVEVYFPHGLQVGASIHTAVVSLVQLISI